MSKEQTATPEGVSASPTSSTDGPLPRDGSAFTQAARRRDMRALEALAETGARPHPDEHASDMLTLTMEKRSRSGVAMRSLRDPDILRREIRTLQRLGVDPAASTTTEPAAHQWVRTVDNAIFNDTVFRDRADASMTYARAGNLFGVLAKEGVDFTARDRDGLTARDAFLREAKSLRPLNSHPGQERARVKAFHQGLERAETISRTNARSHPEDEAMCAPGGRAHPPGPRGKDAPDLDL